MEVSKLKYFILPKYVILGFFSSDYPKIKPILEMRHFVLFLIQNEVINNEK